MLVLVTCHMNPGWSHDASGEMIWDRQQSKESNGQPRLDRTTELELALVRSASFGAARF